MMEKRRSFPWRWQSKKFSGSRTNIVSCPREKNNLCSLTFAQFIFFFVRGHSFSKTQFQHTKAPQTNGWVYGMNFVWIPLRILKASFIYISIHFNTFQYILIHYNSIKHIVWKLLKMSHLIFLILAFSTNFCPIKIDLSGNTVWPQASDFQKLAKMEHFWHF